MDTERAQSRNHSEIRHLRHMRHTFLGLRVSARPQQIRLGLVNASKFKAGNITRTVSVNDATVSEVMEAIEKSLFHD